MVDILVQFDDEQTGCSVTIDDDGRVAYAYLRASDGAIIADVWLYNRCPTPERPAWDRRPTEPFANPKDFVRTDISFALPETEADFTVGWQLEDPSDPKVLIYVREELWGIVAPGTKPGFSRLAKIDGPLAKVLPSQF